MLIFRLEVSVGDGRSRLVPFGRRKVRRVVVQGHQTANDGDRKSTRLNSSHQIISYAVFCLKKKKTQMNRWLKSHAFTTSSLLRMRNPRKRISAFPFATPDNRASSCRQTERALD